MSSVRILVVDDHRDWQNQARLLLQTRPEWEVISEASDGLEAIEKAGELGPDLIVLDIGLPKLNGIEAARRILEVSPDSKIVFLSTDNSTEVIQTALSAGGKGYVHKSRAHSDLLAAIDAVLAGKQFLSSRLEDRKLTEAQVTKTPHCHEVQFYSDDGALVDRFAQFVAAALKAGNAVIVVLTKPHEGSLVQRLKADGVDIDGAIQQGTYISIDATDTLCAIMVDGLPDRTLFIEGVCGLIEAAAKASHAKQPRVAVCGERVGLLWAEGKTDAAIRLEQLCNDLMQTCEIDMLCAYPLSSFQGEEDKEPIESVCAEHSAAFFD